MSVSHGATRLTPSSPWSSSSSPALALSCHLPPQSVRSAQSVSDLWPTALLLHSGGTVVQRYRAALSFTSSFLSLSLLCLSLSLTCLSILFFSFTSLLYCPSPLQTVRRFAQTVWCMYLCQQHFCKLICALSWSHPSVSSLRLPVKIISVFFLKFELEFYMNVYMGVGGVHPRPKAREMHFVLFKACKSTDSCFETTRVSSVQGYNLSISQWPTPSFTIRKKQKCTQWRHQLRYGGNPWQRNCVHAHNTDVRGLTSFCASWCL